MKYYLEKKVTYITENLLDTTVVQRFSTAGPRTGTGP